MLPEGPSDADLVLFERPLPEVWRRFGYRKVEALHPLGKLQETRDSSRSIR